VAVTAVYAGGIGTEVDPYLIGDENVLVDFLNNDLAEIFYFKLTRNMDLAGRTYNCASDVWSTATTVQRAKVDMDGFIIANWGDEFNDPITGYLDTHYLFPSGGTLGNAIIWGYWKNGRFECNIDTGGALVNLCANKYIAFDCHFVFNGDALHGSRSDGPDNYTQVLSDHCLYEFINGADMPMVTDRGHGTGLMERFLSPTCHYYNEAGTDFLHGNITLIGESAPTYLTGRGLWHAIPGRTPLPFGMGARLVYNIAGVLSVNGVHAERTVTIFSSTFERLAETQSDAVTGVYSVDFANFEDAPVYVASHDDVGVYVQLSTDYALGDLISPPADQGFHYACTVAGNTGLALPTYPWATSGDLVIGTATFTPVETLAPAIAGPVTATTYTEA
jgi:hypothetical protein